MPEMGAIGQRFRHRLKTDAGVEFFGQLTDLTDTVARDTSFFAARRDLLVGARAPVAAGDIILLPDGRRALLGFNGDAIGPGVIHKGFKVFDLDRQVSVLRRTTAADTVTGLSRSTGESEVGPIWCALEPEGSHTDFNMAAARYRVLSGFALQVNDKVDGKYTVQRVDTVLGIFLAIVE